MLGPSFETHYRCDWRLERRTTTLADVLGSFITVHHNAKHVDYAIWGLKDHILGAIGKRVKEFEDPIYFIALFLHPACKKMAMSRMMTGTIIIRKAMEIAKDWHFDRRDVILLMKELASYKNGDAPFDTLTVTPSHSPREFWNNFCGSSPLLRRFATKVFSIVPHSAPCERLFSTLGLIKTKPRNRLEVERLNMIAQIKCDLASEVETKRRTCVAGPSIVGGVSMGDFDVSVEDDDVGEDLLNEEVAEVLFKDLNSTIGVMDEFFDFDAFERDNANAPSESNMVTDGVATQGDGDWSIDGIFEEFA